MSHSWFPFGTALLATVATLTWAITKGPARARAPDWPTGFIALGQRGWDKSGLPRRVRRAIDGAEMILVEPPAPADERWRGVTSRTQDGSDVEAPRRPYYLDEMEVTHAMYNRFMAHTGWAKQALRVYGRYGPAGALWCVIGEGGVGSRWVSTREYEQLRASEEPIGGWGPYPVTQVSWYDAAAYCHWAGCGLPTEAEFVLALMAGNPPQTYPWGEVFPPPARLANLQDRSFGLHFGWRDTDIPWDYDDGYALLAPVGSFSPNALGFHDLAGNVSEWVLDDRGDVTRRHARDPGRRFETRVTRGGRWSGTASWVSRVVSRDVGDATSRSDSVGFRCCWSPFDP